MKMRTGDDRLTFSIKDETVLFSFGQIKVAKVSGMRDFAPGVEVCTPPHRNPTELQMVIWTEVILQPY